MERIRKPFQGVVNIVRFNWHFYLISGALVLLIFVLNGFLNESYHIVGNTLGLLITLTITLSLLVSFYVYDLSDLYKLNWLNHIAVDTNSKIVNINAGFDEISVLLQKKYPGAEMQVFDFYDPSKHTEVSIERARKCYPPFPNTKQVNTSSLPLQENYADKIFVVMAAHEIRREAERNAFFKELKRALKPNGNIVVTESLRSLPNFIAYNIGFFHFIPKSSWCRTFKEADLKISKEIRITPFVTTFILEKYGTAS